MKYLTILILALLHIHFINAQSKQHTVDSLTQIIIQSNHDTSTVQAYVSLSEALSANLDTIKHLSEKAKSIAEKSLKNTNISSKEKKAFTIALANAIGNIGYYYGEAGDIDKQEKLYLKSLTLLKQTNSKIDIAATLNNVGYLYGQLGEVEKQKKYYEESLAIRQEIDDKDGTGLSLYNLGLLYFNQGDIKTALEHLYKALKIQEEIDKEEDIASTLNSIGYIYGQQGEVEKQKEYYLKSLAVSEEINDKYGIALIYNNLGSIYKEENNYTKALEYFNNCLQISEEIKLVRGISNSLNNIGNIYEAQNKTDLALETYQKSLSIRKEVNDNSGIINSHLSIGNIHYTKKHFEKAKKHATQGLDLAKKIGYVDEIKLSADLLQKCYYKLGNYKKGWETYRLYINMRDSTNNIETQKTTIKQNMQYEFDKKEALAKAKHEKEIALTEAKKNKQNIIIWAGSIVLILIIGVSIFIANRLKISNQQKLLIQQKNQENELLLGEIHHRVKNNLQVISSLLSLQERNIDDEKTKAAILEGKERVKSMGLIHKMLYQNDNYSGVEMDSYGKELIQGLVDSFGMKKEDLDLSLDFSNLKLDVDTAIPIGLIINELVINSLKYAYDKTNTLALKISLAKESNKLVLEVADNGNGQADDLKNSKSFGMKLIKSLSRQIGGIVSIENNAGISVKIDIANYKLV